MRTLVGFTLLGIAVMLLVGKLAALVDPHAGLRMTDAADVFVAKSPWYAHAGWFAVIALLGWISVRLLSRGYLGRLVRDRGFTPAPESR